jgi:hypothetical protein
MSCLLPSHHNTHYSIANVVMDSDIAVEIPHTLQTRFGMVQFNAAPQKRPLPDLVAYIDALDNSSARSYSFLDAVEHDNSEGN